MLARVAEPDGKSWGFRDEPPILTRLDASEKNHVTEGLRGYLQTIAGEWRTMLERYDVVDVAHRVVGVGSVGTRAYLLLLLGRAHGDPLFMQVKEGIVPAAAPFARSLRQFAAEPQIGDRGTPPLAIRSPGCSVRTRGREPNTRSP